jgi:Putative zinc-finger
MNEINNSPGCERASDLIAFIYDEASESETREFRLHLQECSECRAEVASFGVVRESITAWRDEALSGFVSTPVANTAKKKSAIAALRQFFDLSPLWLKGATAFAAVAFCVLVALAFFRLPANNNNVSSIPPNPSLIYTAQDVDRMVKEALAKQQHEQQPIVVATVTQAPKPKKAVTSSQMAKSRRPLSRAEREQLAADLRLLSTQEDDGLNLLGDRINR